MDLSEDETYLQKYLNQMMTVNNKTKKNGSRSDYNAVDKTFCFSFNTLK